MKEVERLCDQVIMMKEGEVEGTFLACCTEKDKLLVIFDNTYSWINEKQLYYRVTIEASDQTECRKEEETLLLQSHISLDEVSSSTQMAVEKSILLFIGSTNI